MSRQNATKGKDMDYGKSGAPKAGRHEPRNAYETQHGAPTRYGRKLESKEELLAKMKANAEKAKKDAE